MKTERADFWPIVAIEGAKRRKRRTDWQLMEWESGNIQYSLALEPVNQGKTPVNGYEGTEPFVAKSVITFHRNAHFGDPRRARLGLQLSRSEKATSL